MNWSCSSLPAEQVQLARPSFSTWNQRETTMSNHEQNLDAF